MLRKDVLTSNEFDRTSASAAEVARFTSLASEWWKADGAFKIVHRFNAARLTYLEEALPRRLFGTALPHMPLQGVRLADVGCGAGLVAEAMARSGADVVGIDPSARNIQIAREHAAATGVAIDYRQMLPEQLAATGQRFDVVLTLEVIEHVADVSLFLHSCADLVAPGGVLAVATLNRTVRSFLFGIVGAEYVLRFLPRGTHDWRKFIKPSELRARLALHGFRESEICGLSFNPSKGTFRTTRDLGVNFIQLFERRSPEAPDPCAAARPGAQDVVSG